MRFFLILLLTFSLCVGESYADPGGKGKGKGSEKGKGKGKGKGGGNGNSYAKGKDKHKAATIAISDTIAADTGLPAENFTAYSANLANILGQLDTDALARVFGEYFGNLP